MVTVLSPVKVLIPDAILDDYPVEARVTARSALALGALLMLVAVALGAFGAHALKARLAPDLLDVWHTAVQYQAWHALGLIGVGLLLLQRPAARGLRVAAWLFVAGIVLFSGSLYVLALTGAKGLGAITPLGGVAFLGGWIAFAWSAWRN
jgi:uncharacterized membrane protein YgdD (TMEM256/DUF423 family)